MDWIRKKYWKKSLRYPWPWKSTVKVTFHFLHKQKLEMAFQRHWCAKNGKNSEKKSLKHLWPWNRDFQGQRCLREFFYYFFFIFSAWNYIEVPSQIFMTNETKFLHCALHCLRGLSIYRPAVRSGTLPQISSDFMYEFCIL